jgi:hypothetical protein
MKRTIATESGALLRQPRVLPDQEAQGDQARRRIPNFSPGDGAPERGLVRAL